MRRLSLLPLLLTLTLLASCGPQPATPTSAPTITQSPNHSITQSPTPTPTPYPLSPYPLSPDLQHTLETRQGWTFTWDPSRGAYIITQRAWDADQAQFNSSTLGEVGYVDREAILHLHSASFTATTGGEKSAFQSSASHDEITIDLSQFTRQPTSTPAATTTSTPEVTATTTATATPETSQNNATERQLGPFTLIETKNPLFADTGILKFTDENGNTWVYAPQIATSVEVDGRKIVEFYDASLAIFSPEQKTIDPSQIPVIDWDALHKGLGPALAIVNGFDRQFSEHLRDTFEGYKILFQAFPELQNPNNPQIPATAVLTYAPLFNEKNQYKYPPGQGPIRYATDENSNTPFFYTITPDSQRILCTLMQIYNPDLSNPSPDDIEKSLIIPVVVGNMTDEQITNFPDFYNSQFSRYIGDGLIHPSPREFPFPQIILATQGYFFRELDAYVAKHPNFITLLPPQTRNSANARIFVTASQYPDALASLDQLLGREGNDVRNDIYINAYIEHFKELGVIDPNTGKTIDTLEYIKAHLDENGNIVYEQIWTNLQLFLLGVGF